MPITTSFVEPDLTQPDAGRARRRATARAVALSVLVAAIASTLIEVVCGVAGWDPDNWSVIAVVAGYLAADHLLTARRARQAELTGDQDAMAGAGAAGR